MRPHFFRNLPAFALALGLTSGTASAVTSFTESFDTGASGWLNGSSTSPTHFATGGIGNSGYISHTATFTSAESGSFGAPPLQLMFRGNNADDASGDAFVGNWITSGVATLTLSVRHNHTTSLNFYSRLASTAGGGASLAVNEDFEVPSNTWTTISIPITDSSSTFLSYGAGTFDSVFANIQNLQLGFYVPGNTTFTDFTVDVDNISVTVPEPASLGLIAFAGAGATLLRRRRTHI